MRARRVEAHTGTMTERRAMPQARDGEQHDSVPAAAHGGQRCGAQAMDPVDRAEYDRNVAGARSQIGAEQFDAAWVEGQAMTPEQAIAYALDTDDPAR